MAMSKKKRVYILAIVLVIFLVTFFIGFTVYKKVSTPKPLFVNSEEAKRLAAEEIKKRELKQLTDPNTKIIYDLYNAKKYDEVIAKSKITCDGLSDNIQLICYRYYAQALEAKNMLPELTVLAKKVLNMDSAKKNETATNIWKFILENSEKGVNPANVKIDGSDAEARS